MTRWAGVSGEANRYLYRWATPRHDTLGRHKLEEDARMGKYLQILAVCCPMLFLMVGRLKAQEKTELLVGVMAIKIDAGTTDRKPVTVTSEAARLLSRLLSDTQTQLISR